MENLRKTRKERNLTMKEVGIAIGVGESTISQYETGKRQPDQQNLLKLADYFGVTVDYLLGRETDTERDEKPQLHIPDKYKDVLVAFEGGADDLTQEDVDKVIEYIELLRTKNRSKK